MDKWFLARAGGSPIGPVRTDALLRRIRGGTLAPETLVWAEGMAEWVALSRVPQLAVELMRDVDDTSPSGMPEVEDAKVDLTAKVSSPTKDDEPEVSLPKATPAKVDSATAPKVASKPPPKVEAAADRPEAAAKLEAPPARPLHPSDDVPTWVDPPSSPRNAPFKRVDTPAPPPYPAHFLRPPEPAPTPFPVRQPARTPAQHGPASASGKQTRQRTYAAVAIVFVVGLVVGMFGIRELIAVRRTAAERRSAEERLSTRSRQTLYVPCFGAALPELSSLATSREGPCGEGSTLTLKRDAGALVLTMKGLDAQGLAARTPELLARMLPNLPAPTVSRALPLRQVLRLDLRGAPDPGRRLQAAIKTYHDAELLVEGYEAMGGHRYARWSTDDGTLDVENRVTSDGPCVVVRLHTKAEAAAPAADGDETAEGDDAAWGGAWEVRVDPPDLGQLRKKMMAAGFWFDDADAFMSAAASAGLERSAETTDALAVVAEWVHTSDGWTAPTRARIWNDCLGRITANSVSAPQGGAAGGFSRQRYDELAGVWKDAAIFSELLMESRHPQNDVVFYGRAFNATLGSPLHMFCVAQAGERLIQSPEDSPENHAVRRAPEAVRGLAERLIASPQFATALGAELVKARTQLLKPGEPEL